MSATPTIPAMSARAVSVAELVSSFDDEASRHEAIHGETPPVVEDNRKFLRDEFRKAVTDELPPEEAAETSTTELDELLRQYNEGIEQSDGENTTESEETRQDGNRPRNRVDDILDRALNGENGEPAPKAESEPAWTAEQLERHRADLAAAKERNRYTLQHYERARTEAFAARDKADVADLVTYAKQTKPELAELSDADIEAHLTRAAGADPAIARAWQSRYEDGDTWGQTLPRIVSAVSTSAAPTIERLRQAGSRSDVERAAAAIRNLSTSPAPRSDFNPHAAMKWSPQQWETYLEEIGAK